MALANENIGSLEPDYLVYDSRFPIATKTISLAGAQGDEGKLERGTVIAVTETITAAVPAGTDTGGGVAPVSSEFSEIGVAWTGAPGQVARFILCDEVDTGDDEEAEVVALVYASGHFTRQALKFGEGADELTKAAEKQLQDAGIYVSNAAI